MNQVGNISGVVVRVGGVGDSIPVLMESEGEHVAGCHTNRHLAKSLAHHLFEPVRLSGRGYWMRDAEGRWLLKHFRIDGFKTLEPTTLGSALTELRAIAGERDEGGYLPPEHLQTEFMDELEESAGAPDPQAASMIRPPP